VHAHTGVMSRLIGPAGCSDVSTLSGGVPLPMPASACERMRGAAASASVESGEWRVGDRDH